MGGTNESVIGDRSEFNLPDGSADTHLHQERRSDPLRPHIHGNWRVAFLSTLSGSGRESHLDHGPLFQLEIHFKAQRSRDGTSKISGLRRHYESADSGSRTGHSDTFPAWRTSEMPHHI